MMVDGKRNIEHLRWMARKFNRTLIDSLDGKAELPKGVTAAGMMDYLAAECRLCGHDPKHLLDLRTDAQIMEETVNRILESPESLGEQIDSFYTALSNEMDIADKHCAELAEAPGSDAELLRERRPKIKKWLARIQKVRALRDRARNRIPKGYSRSQGRALEMAHPLRYMIWVGRPALGADNEKPQIHFTVKAHHAKMAHTVYSAIKQEILTDGKWIKYKAKGAFQILPPGHGKPLSVDTPILMGDGTHKRLGDISVGDEVIGHSGLARRITHVFEQGVLPCLKIKTHGGREVVTALDHPFLTADGWKEAKDLLPGDALALVHGHEPGRNPVSEAECRLAGYFAGDGSTAHANVTNADPEIIESVCASATSMGFEVTVRDKATTKAKTIAVKSGVRDWLRAIDMDWQRSATKTVPRFVMESDNRGVAAFIAAYFECDGTVTKKGMAREDCCIQFSSVSRKLLEGVQSLLLRLGIQSRIRNKTSRCQTGAVCYSFVLELSSQHETGKFAKRIPVIGPKADRLRGWHPRMSKFDGDFLPDAIVSIETHEPTACRCITVDTDHTFLANDLVVHNSAFISHVISLMISENPSLRCIFLHAQEEMAQQNLGMVASNFDPNEACGRRNLSLFPGIEIEERSSKKFRLKLPERQKSPTIIAVGITAAKSGTDADILWNDDPCDQKLAEQPTERKRAWDRINATWRTRLRGTRNFEFYTSTLWHYDDPTAKMLALVKAGSAKYTMCRLKCGGPKDNFKPLWEEQYPASYLKQKYMELGPRLYATVYESNPQPEELRKIKRLAYYDPRTTEHYSFIESAIFHISLDPTAKRDEKCDKAAFVYAAFGDIVAQGTGEYSYEKRLRIIDAHQFHASQSEGVDEVIGFAGSHSTHYIHIENRGGFDATREFFEKEGMDVICHDPGNRKKGLRLADVAAMLDDSLRDKGFPGAVVEFPGRSDASGNPVADPDSPLKWVEDQVLDFGVATEDHVVDATTQLCKFLGPELRVNVGAVTEKIQRMQQRARDPRVAKWVDRLMGRGGPGPTADAEDARFLTENE